MKILNQHEMINLDKVEKNDLRGSRDIIFLVHYSIITHLILLKFSETIKLGTEDNNIKRNACLLKKMVELSEKVHFGPDSCDD